MNEGTESWPRTDAKAVSCNDACLWKRCLAAEDWGGGEPSLLHRLPPFWPVPARQLPRDRRDRRPTFYLITSVCRIACLPRRPTTRVRVQVQVQVPMPMPMQIPAAAWLLPRLLRVTPWRLSPCPLLPCPALPRPVKMMRRPPIYLSSSKCVSIPRSCGGWASQSVQGREYSLSLSFRARPREPYVRRRSDK